LLSATTFDFELLKEINITDSNGNAAGGDLIIKVKAGNTTADYDGTDPDIIITLTGAGGTTAADASTVLSLLESGLDTANIVL